MYYNFKKASQSPAVWGGYGPVKVDRPVLYQRFTRFFDKSYIAVPASR